MGNIMILIAVLVQLAAAVNQFPDRKPGRSGPTTETPLNCALPAPPRNGKYQLLGKWERMPAVGELVVRYVLDVSCDRGFSSTGPILAGCDERGRNDPIPECVAVCKRSTPDLISCGADPRGGEARCLIPDDNALERALGTPFTNASITTAAFVTEKKQRFTCGEIPNIFKAAVAGGRMAGKKEVPWHVGVYTKTTKPYMQICGGTLVGPRIVISAAHCFWHDITKQQPAAQYAVAAGKVFRPFNDAEDEAAQKSDVAEIRIPPRYQGAATNFQDDIAIVFTTREFIFGPYVVPACLDFAFDFDETQLSHKRKGKVAGWGLTSADGPASQVLRVAEMPVIDIQQCIASSDAGALATITSDKICAGYTNGTAVCRGDSGGGFLVPEVLSDVKRYFLRGVVSTAPKNEHKCNVYTAARFTHVFRHEYFIKKAIYTLHYQERSKAGNLDQQNYWKQFENLTFSDEGKIIIRDTEGINVFQILGNNTPINTPGFSKNETEKGTGHLGHSKNDTEEEIVDDVDSKRFHEDSVKNGDKINGRNDLEDVINIKNTANKTKFENGRDSSIVKSFGTNGIEIGEQNENHSKFKINRTQMNDNGIELPTEDSITNNGISSSYRLDSNYRVSAVICIVIAHLFVLNK